MVCIPPRPARCPHHSTGYTRGCPGCQAYKRGIVNRNNRLKAYGLHRPESLLDAGDCRDHLNKLHDAGMTWVQIADRSGMNKHHIDSIAHGDTRKVTQYTRSLILGVPFEPFRAANLRDSTGTRRRLEALACLGYSQPQIGRLTGRPNMTGSHVRNWMITKRVTHEIADVVRSAYDKYSMVPSDNPRATYTKRYAARQGWAPPLAWDEGDIDDPAAVPNFGHKQGDPLPDESAIVLVLEGRVGEVGRPLFNSEKREIVRRGHKLGWSGREIGRVAGLSNDAVNHTLSRMREEGEA